MVAQWSLLYRRALLLLCFCTAAAVLLFGASSHSNLRRYLSLAYFYEFDYRSQLNSVELSVAQNFTASNWDGIRKVAGQFAGHNTGHIDQLFVEKFPVLSVRDLQLRTPSGRELDYRQLLDSVERGSDEAGGGLTPNVVHYVLPFRRPELQFHELLSLLATFHLVRPKRVFLWHSEPPRDGYWNYLRANVTDERWESTVVMASRKPPDSVYQMPVAWWRHRADLVGLEAVLMFGGLRLAMDVVPLRPANLTERRAETVIGLQHERGIGSAAFLAKRNSRFLLAWHLCYQLLDDSMPDQHPTLLPYALHAAFPQFALLELLGMHRPGWQPDQLRLLYEPRRDADSWDWRGNWLVNLWRNHYKGIDHNLESVRQLDSPFGEMARFILFGTSSLLPVNVADVAGVSASPATTPSPAPSPASKDFVYAPMDKAFVTSQFEKLRDSIRGFSGKYSSRVNELMVHRLPVVDMSQWRLHSPGGRKYTVAEVQLMTRDPNYVVPNVAHYVLPFENPQLQFHHLVCMLSGVWVMRPSHVVIWYVKQPHGEHWEAFRKNLTDSGISETKVVMINRPVPTRSYTVPVHVKEHQADVMRMEAVLVFGGAYFDIDVVTLKPLEPLRKYPFTIGRETGGGLCNGVFLAAPNSTFMSMWYVTYQTLDDGSWVGHSVSYPNTLCPMYSAHCHVEEESMDRPNWTGGELPWIYGRERKWDWRKKNYVMHLWYRFHGHQYNMETIKYVDSMLGDMFRYVLYGNPQLVKKP